jgi:hypothetical protein
MIRAHPAPDRAPLTLLTVACLAFGLIVGLEKTVTQSQFG